MRKLLLLVVAAVLVGCAAQGNPVRNYIDTYRPQAERGELKWSEYYERLYNVGSVSNVPGDALARINEAIQNAKQYESGALTKDEFAYRMRSLDATQRSAEQHRVEQAQVQAVNQLAVAAQLMQASQPHTLPQVQAVPAVGNGPLGLLQSQSVNGFLRYCRYSNGIITTISSVSLCPLNTGQ